MIFILTFSNVWEFTIFYVSGEHENLLKIIVHTLGVPRKHDLTSLSEW